MTEHIFAQYIRILGKGKTGTRSLSLNEAFDAFSLILQGQATPEQIGAFLMLLRVKEESSEEIAGFVKACKHFINTTSQQAASAIQVDIDWSSYAGKRKQSPWFIAAAALLAENGKRVFIHGAQGHTEGRIYTQQAAAQFGIPVANNWQAVSSALDAHNICFMPITAMCQPLDDLIQLRSLLGLRSPVHTLCRLINPCNAEVSLSSIFHPAYATTHQQAAHLLGQTKMAVFKGESGEIERKADATCLVKSLSHGKLSEHKWPRLQEAKQPAVKQHDLAQITQLWQSNAPENAEQHYGQQAIIGTLAIILSLMDELTPEQANDKALALWQARNRNNLFFN